MRYFAFLIAMSCRKMWTTVAAVVVLLGVQSFVQEVASIWREGDGGVQFVFKGQTYSFSSKDCSGGVLFKKPLDLESVCPHGYFLQRPKGCSSSREIIIAGEKLQCPEMNERRSVRVQAFIPMTNPGNPTEHTIALYNDPDTLQGFRRYTMRLAKARGYAGGLNGSSFLVVSNPHKIPETSIGPLCYQGIHGANGAAYKVHLKGNLTRTNDKSLFRNGCDPLSVHVNLKEAKKFAMADGFSKRFVRGAGHKQRSDSLNRNTKNKAGEKSDSISFFDVISDPRDPRSVALSSKTKNHLKTFSDESIANKYAVKPKHASMKSIPKSQYSKPKKDGKKRKDNGKSIKDFAAKTKFGGKQVQKKFMEGTNKVYKKFLKNMEFPIHNKATENKLKYEKIAAMNKEMNPVAQPSEGSSDPKKKRSKVIETRKELSKETGSEEIINNWSIETTYEEDVEKLYHKTPESDLKETIIVDDHTRFVSAYFMEMVTIGRTRVTELLRGKNLSDPSVPSLFKNNQSSSLQTDWYALMKKQVKVAETIVPETVMPRGLFQDALNAFSFMFRNLPDRQILQNLKGLLGSLSECQKWYKTNQVKIELDNTTTSCPPKVSNVSEKPSFLWNVETDSPQELSEQMEDSFPNQDPIRFRHKTFPGNTNLIVQLMFTAMDIVHVACFKRFQPSQVNLHSRMTYYLMSNVFLSPEVHEYWKQGDMSPNVFVSLLPNWNSGKSLQKIGEEIDLIRLELRKATVYHSWITTDPNQYSMKRIPFESEESMNGISYGSHERRRAREHVEELIKAFLYLEGSDESGDPEETRPTKGSDESGEESKVEQTPEIPDENEKEPETTDTDDPEESAGDPGQEEAPTATRKKRNTNMEKLRHREIWNGLAYCLSLTEEKTRKGETIQLGIHPSLELLQTQIAC